jgi:nitrile hydratase subunit beta
MARTHDMGGRPSNEPLNLEEHILADWEVVADALNVALGTCGLRTTDEHRRVMEDMPPDEYLSLSYYERWVRGAEQLLVEKGILTREEVDRKMAELEPTWGVS